MIYRDAVWFTVLCVGILGGHSWGTKTSRSQRDKTYEGVIEHLCHSNWRMHDKLDNLRKENEALDLRLQIMGELRQMKEIKENGREQPNPGK